MFLHNMSLIISPPWKCPFQICPCRKMFFEKKSSMMNKSSKFKASDIYILTYVNDFLFIQTCKNHFWITKNDNPRSNSFTVILPSSNRVYNSEIRFSISLDLHLFVRGSIPISIWKIIWCTVSTSFFRESMKLQRLGWILFIRRLKRWL